MHFIFNSNELCSYYLSHCITEDFQLLHLLSHECSINSHKQLYVDIDIWSFIQVHENSNKYLCGLPNLHTQHTQYCVQIMTN